jgi:hypothetical protein
MELESSDYFLFIDFPREFLVQIYEGALSGREHRGSLFVNQELAIASYLDIQVLYFQHSSVKKRDGLNGHLHINAQEFKSLEQLPDLIKSVILEANWSPKWKNALKMEYVAKRFADENDYYHIDVKNHHNRKHATNCYAYLSNVENCDTGKSIECPIVETKWAGVGLANVVIRAGDTRKFDGFRIAHLSPGASFRRNTFADTHEYEINLQDMPYGSYILTFEVLSDNFPKAEQKFEFVYSKKPQDCSLSEKVV